MRIYSVTLPITGVAYVDVEAESEEEAILKAFDECTIENIDLWEPLRRVNQGNICYAMQPWEATAQDEGEVE